MEDPNNSPQGLCDMNPTLAAFVPMLPNSLCSVQACVDMFCLVPEETFMSTISRMSVISEVSQDLTQSAEKPIANFQILTSHVYPTPYVLSNKIIATSSKGIATSSKKLLVTRASLLGAKDATRGSWPYY